jgi:hypothetical protein
MRTPRKTARLDCASNVVDANSTEQLSVAEASCASTLPTATAWAALKSNASLAVELSIYAFQIYSIRLQVGTHAVGA